MKYISVSIKLTILFFKEGYLIAFIFSLLISPPPCIYELQQYLVLRIRLLYYRLRFCTTFFHCYADTYYSIGREARAS